MLSAPVDFVGNAVSNQSGTIELRATFLNDDLSLVPGQLVNVTVELNDIPGALVVPRDAVNDSPNGSFVFLVKDGQALERPVTVLTDDGHNAAISGSLSPRDQVVIEGQLRVVPGGKVRVLAKKSHPAPRRAEHVGPVHQAAGDDLCSRGGGGDRQRLRLCGPAGQRTCPISIFPTISVQASLPGADPQTMASAVATPLENVFASIPGLDTMTSTSFSRALPASRCSSG